MDKVSEALQENGHSYIQTLLPVFVAPTQQGPFFVVDS